ncbi:Zn-dependent hydrolase [Hoeflea sp. WL0058]|uniref:Zn-dependent hydrolase n=1 Tax=Flavimaribacter sediminis TaxID=2865987 RepID=A0AAE3CZ69_9HYPH|nr:Zn-dependent hydrolase [Flavimaribacter sediminis]MBW8636354.1 Zn-dependent hydrolase [Flavimaribacter sediminis]
MPNNPAINSKRLKSLLDAVNSFGRNPQTGGFNRIGYSDPDLRVRRWFADTLRAEGLSVSQDGVANVFGRFGPAEGPCIMAGSHLDTVPEGGAFDGALGVCAALECILAMKDAGYAPDIAIEIVATAEEEGRFGGMLGSQAISGQIQRTWIDQAVDADGLTLVDAMAQQGLDAYSALSCARAPGTIEAFLELHIEQGPVLESRNIPIGVADSVSGVVNLGVRLEGRANHSGTTPMDLRADAFAGLAELGAALPSIIEQHGDQQTRVTIGKVELQPNFPHTIPGLADFSIVIRDSDAALLQRVVEAVRDQIVAISSRHSLTATIDERSRLAPVELDTSLVAILREESDRLGSPSLVMPSGAGHDAQTMQALCPAALIFVPSRDGVSHAPEEWTDWSAIDKGANLLLAALIRLSRAKT